MFYNHLSVVYVTATRDIARERWGGGEEWGGGRERRGGEKGGGWADGVRKIL